MTPSPADLEAIEARAAEWGFSIHDGRALISALRERNAEIKQLRDVLVAVRPFINAWGSQTDLDQIDAALANDKEPGR